MERTIITIKPFSIDNYIIKSSDVNGLPTTDRRYRISKEIKNTLEQFRYEKKGTIEIAELYRIKKNLTKLPTFEADYSLKEIFTMMGRLNGLAANSQNEIYRRNSISPKIMEQAILKLSNQIKTDVLNNDEIIKLKEEIEQKNQRIRMQDLKIEALKEVIDEIKIKNNEPDILFDIERSKAS